MVLMTTAFYEILVYVLTILRFSGELEIIPFLKILLVEVIFNTLITIIIYPIIKKVGYYLENQFEDKFMLTRYF